MYFSLYDNWLCGLWHCKILNLGLEYTYNCSLINNNYIATCDYTIIRVFPTVYGWTDDFPIEVEKGQMLTLTIGYLKGFPPGQILFRVEYNTTGRGIQLFL